MKTTTTKTELSKALDLIERCVAHGILQEISGEIICLVTSSATLEKEFMALPKEAVAEKIINENLFDTLTARLNEAVAAQ